MLNLDKFWKKIHRRAVVWDTITTSFWSTLGKFMGFLIPFFIAAWYGVTSETDAFFFVYGLIVFMAGVFSSVVESIIVPYVAELRVKEENIGNFVGGILLFGGLGLIILTILLFSLCKLILPLITRFSPDLLKLIYLLLLETSPLIFFLACTSVMAGVLNAYKKFAFPAVSPALRAIVCLIFIFAFKNRIGVHAIAFGYVVGEIIRFVTLNFIVYKFRILRLRLFSHFNHRLLDFLKTSFYQIIGMTAIGFKPVIGRIMVSWLGVGSVSILHYADRLYMIPTIFITSGFAVVALSHWSVRFYNSGKERLKDDIRRAEKVLLLIALVISGILILFNRNIVNVAFSRGAFDRTKLSEVALVWLCYVLGFVPHALEQIYIKGFIVLKNTKILMRCAIYINIFFIVLNLILMPYFNIAAIALSTSIISYFSFIYLRVKFFKLIKK